MKKQRKNEIGITLVALVITIIILLILAGIAILILNHTGLLKNVKQAKDTTENAQKEENETLSKYNNKIYEIVNGATRDDNSGKGNILWKNNDITQEFPAQTITINDSLNNYDYIKIFYKTNNVSNSSNPTVDNKTFSTECLVINNGIDTTLATSWYMAGWAGHPLYYRIINGKENKITFESAYSSGSGSNNVLYNKIMLPYYIIGYKF